MDTTDRAVDDFLEGNPRAEDWRRLRLALENRLSDLRAHLASTPRGDSTHARARRQIVELEAQVDALRQEEAVSRFVEDSVRATISLPRPESDDEDE
ncbi:MAG: hypothetical protein ACKO5K_09845 [Armatimonadota bacterium]